MEVVVTSRDTIKPSRPTPQGLRHLLPFSLFDQLMYRVFIPMSFFYSKGSASENDDTIKATNHATSNILKTSLAETLVKFYPFAGVPYYEAQAKCNISQVVGESCLPKLNKLLPYGQKAGDLPLAIQVNFFDCGGIAVGVCLSHKVADASSLSSFLNHWAGIARGHPRMNLICPRFDSAKLFPPVEKQIPEGTAYCSTSARRFVFTASALSAIKSKHAMPTTRTEVLSAFIWSALLAARKRKDASADQRPLLAHHCVDLRTRMDPPLSDDHIGNIFGYASVGSSMDASMADDCFAGSVFLAKSRDAIRSVDGKFIKNLQNPDSAYRFLQNNIAEQLSNLYFSSLFKFPLYEADFGYGRPLWVTMSGLHELNNFVFMPTRSGDGAEVLAYLNKDDMAKLEADEEFLEFVSPPSGVKNLKLDCLL